MLRLSVEPAEDVAGGAIGGGARGMTQPPYTGPNPCYASRREMVKTSLMVEGATSRFFIGL